MDKAEIIMKLSKTLIATNLKDIFIQKYINEIFINSIQILQLILIIGCSDGVERIFSGANVEMFS